MRSKGRSILCFSLVLVIGLFTRVFDYEDEDDDDEDDDDEDDDDEDGSIPVHPAALAKSNLMQSRNRAPRARRFRFAPSEPGT